jgi:hypothetical protein
MAWLTQPAVEQTVTPSPMTLAASLGCPMRIQLSSPESEPGKRASDGIRGKELTRAARYGQIKELQDPLFRVRLSMRTTFTQGSKSLTIEAEAEVNCPF